ncbi:MAG: glycosyltransferase [Thermoplasmata archaeon]
MTKSPFDSQGTESSPLHIQLCHVATVRTRSGPTLTGGAGGGLVHAVGLAQEWTRQGHFVTVFTNLPAMFEGRCTRVVVVEGTNPGMIQPHGGSLLEPLRTFLDVLASKPGLEVPAEHPSPFPHTSIIIAASPNLADLTLARRLSRSSGVPVIVTFHHLSPRPWWYTRRRGGIVRCTGAWLLTQTALLITKVQGFVPSIDQVRILSESGWRFSGPVLRDEIFLDDCPNYGSLTEADRPIDVCFVSRLSAAKGLFDLLPTLLEVHRRLPTVRLVIGGDFESESVERQFRLAAERKGLSGSLTLKGHLSNEAKRDLLATCKIFAFPSYEEGWSLSVMEAAACGCVPVVYDLPAYDYMGSAIPRVSPGDVKALAERLADLLRNPRKRNEVAGRLEMIPRTFTVEQTARDQIAFFRTLLR